MLLRHTRIPLLIASLAMLFAATGCRRSGGSIERGDEYFQKRDFRAAALEYRAVVESQPQDGAARQKLARTYREVGAMQQAWGEFVRAADLLPDSVTAQLDAADALLATGQFEDARTRAEKVVSKDANNVRAHIVRGLATAGLKDTDSAVDEIKKAVELDPSRATAFANLGVLQLASGRVDEAEASLKRAAALAPTESLPKLALANFYWLSNRRDQAEAMLKQALTVKPTDPAVNQAMAVLYIVSGRSAEAEPPMKAYAANGGPEGQLALADYYIGRNRPEDATPVLEKVSAVKEAHAAAQARLAGIDYLQNRRQAAYDKLDRIVKDDPKNAQVQVLKGRWLLGEKRYNEALATANAAVAADAKSPNAFYLLGNVRAARNELTEAIAAFNEVLRLNPRAAAAQLELAHLNTVVGKGATAVQVASTLVTADPTNLDARLALVKGLRQQGDLARAARELKPLIEKVPKSEPVQSEAGALALAQRDFPGAAARFDAALTIDPDSFEAAAGRVQVAVEQKKTADAVRLADARLAKHPKDPPSLSLAGRTHAIAGDLAKSETLLQQAIAADSAYLPAYYLLGQIYVRQKRLGDARQRYEEMAGRQPNNIAAHTMVAMLLQAENKPAEAKARYEKILQIDSRAVAAANNLAYMHAEAGTDLDLALQLAQVALTASPDEPEYNDTLGWVYYKRDLASLAVGPLRKSAERVPKNPTYRYHLGMAYLKTGDQQKAREMLQDALRLNPRFTDAADAKRALDGLVASTR